MKNICIHGHFYQPPRENPWLEEIEIQETAFPFKDWNERVSAECYAPNAASRILDNKENIVDIVNNYSRINFNFGPTLLSWMRRSHPEVYQKLLEADRKSRDLFSGHGSAIAQTYNHMIMPLANRRDKRTQVIWGIKDFEFHFKRRPKGMWLPETAVDVESLEALAESGILYTVLSPYQAKRIRAMGEEDWVEVSKDGLDPQFPYLCCLPSGKTMVIFFYDGPISHDVAFGGLLNNGENFAKRLLSVFPQDTAQPRLVNIATDGETYGHHHRFGNMALSYCLFFLESQDTVRLTNYGEFLEKYPPQWEVEIVENSSWSCSHGVERWRDDCGCRIGTNPGWHQKWRLPLRQAMDFLRDQVNPIYEKEMSVLVKDPWRVRDEYIRVILDRSQANASKFVREFAKHDLSQEEKIRFFKLLEMARHAMLMYSSCGWFFDDIGGIEAMQILSYAARVIQLAKEISGRDEEKRFLEILEPAISNVPEKENGAQIYRKVVQPQVKDLLNVGAHYAISSLFQKYPATAQLYCYDVKLEDYEQYRSGKQRMVIGRAALCSHITWEEARFEFAVLLLGDDDYLKAGVRDYTDAKAYQKMHQDLKKVFLGKDTPETLKKTKEYFQERQYALWDLFKNEQGHVLGQVFDETMTAMESQFREIFDQYYLLMHSHPGMKNALPKALAMTVEFVLSRDFVTTLESGDVDLERLARLAKEIKRWSVARDKEALSVVAGKRIYSFMEEFSSHPKDLILLKRICAALCVIRSLNLPLNLWEAQNIYFSIAKDTCPGMVEKKAAGNKSARQWLSKFQHLGKYLKVKVKLE